VLVIGFHLNGSPSDVDSCGESEETEDIYEPVDFRCWCNVHVNLTWLSE